MPKLILSDEDRAQLSDVVRAATSSLFHHLNVYIGLTGNGKFVCSHQRRTMQDGENATTILSIQRDGHGWYFVNLVAALGDGPVMECARAALERTRPAPVFQAHWAVSDAPLTGEPAHVHTYRVAPLQIGGVVTKMTGPPGTSRVGWAVFVCKCDGYHAERDGPILDTLEEARAHVEVAWRTALTRESPQYLPAAK